MPAEEKEDQVGNGQPDDYSFASTVCALFLLGKRQDCHLDVVDDEIILASKWEPLRNITFSLNRWAHLMGCRKDIDDTVKKLSRGERHPVLCRMHLGDGYYIRVLYNLRRVYFDRYFVPYGYKVT